MKRKRSIYIFLIILTIALGLLSRQFSSELNPFIAKYSGDALWALMVYFIFGLILSKSSPVKIAALSLLFSFFIEFSQLYQAEWIDTLRENVFGALILGHGFLWSDLLCYSAGIAIGLVLEKIWPLSFINKINSL